MRIFSDVVAFAVALLSVHPDLVLGQDQVLVSVVDSNGEEIVGLGSNGVDAFLGITYATVDDGRFSPSKPVLDPVGSTINATAYGSMCFQPKFLEALMDTNPIPQSEECLNLNIWRPTNTTAGDDLPVMVWIHGGAWYVGSGIDPIYGGAALARAGGVVVVTINYRLGVFGQILKDETGSGGMHWLQDQINALTWIQEHITAFGGDSGRVTVFGESAGSGSICLLAVSPAAKGLFRRAIMQSGPCIYGPISPATVEEGWARTQSFLDAVGASSVDDLLKYTGEELTHLAGANFSSNGIVDGTLLPKQPLELFKEGSGSINPTEIIIGATSFDDATIFILSPEEYASAAYQLPGYIHSLFNDQYGPSASQLAVEAYDTENVYNGSSFSAFAQFNGDWVFRCASRELAAIAATGGVPSYMYNFAHWSKNDFASLFGHLSYGNVSNPSWATHGSEVIYVFGNMDQMLLPANDVDLSLSAELVSRWTAFAHSGDPNAEGLEEWVPLSSDLVSLAPEESSTVPAMLFQGSGLGGSYMLSGTEKMPQCTAIPGISWLRADGSIITDPTASSVNSGTRAPTAISSWTLNAGRKLLHTLLISHLPSCLSLLF